MQLIYSTFYILFLVFITNHIFSLKNSISYKEYTSKIKELSNTSIYNIKSYGKTSNKALNLLEQNYFTTHFLYFYKNINTITTLLIFLGLAKLGQHLVESLFQTYIYAYNLNIIFTTSAIISTFINYIIYNPHRLKILNTNIIKRAWEQHFKLILNLYTKFIKVKNNCIGDNSYYYKLEQIMLIQINNNHNQVNKYFEDNFFKRLFTMLYPFGVNTELQLSKDKYTIISQNLFMLLCRDKSFNYYLHVFSSKNKKWLKYRWSYNLMCFTDNADKIDSQEEKTLKIELKELQDNYLSRELSKAERRLNSINLA